MATTRGCLGKVKAITNPGAPALMGEVKSWSYEETSEQIDASSIGTCAKSFIAGATATTGTIESWWDPDDAAQLDMVVGDVVDIFIYPGGSGSGSTYYATPTGTGAVVTSVNRSGSTDSVVTNNFGFSVNGSLTTETVP